MVYLIDLIQFGNTACHRACSGTPAELENALKSLGAEVTLEAQDERMLLSGSTLSRNFAATMALAMSDLQRLHARSFAPGIARMREVGDVDERAVMASLATLASAWKSREAEAPIAALPAAPAKPALYFYDVADSKQSMLLFGAPSLRRADADFHPATVMNYILGGGSFASRLVQQLRESKGYTYGVRSRFDGGRAIGAFETSAGKLGMLASIGDYGLPVDYVARERRTIDEMTVERVRSLAEKYLQPGHMTYVVVGDRASQAKRLEALGLGPVISANSLLGGGQAPD